MDPAFIREAILLYFMILIGLTVHEWAHAFAADKLGDPTARMLGRLTLNPLAHMTLVGSVIFPLAALLIFRGFIAMGKPTPVNISNFHPKERARKHVLVTLAGPLSNLGLAFIGAVLAGIVNHFSSGFVELLLSFVKINVWLFIFNMIPIPPLDGSHLLRYAANMSEETFYRLSQFGFWILLGVMMFVPGASKALAFVAWIISLPFLFVFNLIA